MDFLVSTAHAFICIPPHNVKTLKILDGNDWSSKRPAAPCVRSLWEETKREILMVQELRWPAAFNACRLDRLVTRRGGRTSWMAGLIPSYTWFWWPHGKFGSSKYITQWQDFCFLYCVNMFFNDALFMRAIFRQGEKLRWTKSWEQHRLLWSNHRWKANLQVGSL
jgi:hypothetical protein